jgi:hypothetical protein
MDWLPGNWRDNMAPLVGHRDATPPPHADPDSLQPRFNERAKSPGSFRPITRARSVTKTFLPVVRFTIAPSPRTQSNFTGAPGSLGEKVVRVGAHLRCLRSHRAISSSKCSYCRRQRSTCRPGIRPASCFFVQLLLLGALAFQSLNLRTIPLLFATRMLRSQHNVPSLF